MPLSLSIQSRIQYQHRTIEELIEYYSEDQLRVRVIPGKWSAFENIAHLVRYQLIFQDRIERIVNSNNPTFDRYVAENDTGFLEYTGNTVSRLMESLNTTRNQIHKTLTTLPDSDFERTGVHPKFGRLSLVQWSEFFLLHEAHHLFTLFKLLNDQEKAGTD
jgi:hypothetical protein